ncbi:MAG: protein kinase [Planctomycetota bacterium]
MTPKPGDAIGPFTLGRLLGQGGMGAVFVARHANGAEVALKVLLDPTPTILERFKRELAAMARVDRHPGVVRVHTAGTSDRGVPYVVMDLVDGGDLARAIGGRPLEPLRAARIVEKVARAIDHCHAQGVIHRDLKPANVLLKDDEPLVTDFGLARDDTAERLTRTGELVGTPAYMAPEQLGEERAAIERRTDVYALGAVLYECLTGEPPFKSDSTPSLLRMVLVDDPVDPRRKVPAVPRDLAVIALKCLAKEPAARYPSARAVAEELGRFLDGEAIHARPSSAFERFARRLRRNRAAALAAALVTLLVVGGVVLGVREVGRREEQAARDARDRAIVAETEALEAQLKEVAKGLPVFESRFPVERWVTISRVVGLAARCAALDAPASASARTTVAATRDLARNILRYMADVALGDEEFPLGLECLTVLSSLSPADAEIKREIARIAPVSSQDRHSLYMRYVLFAVDASQQGDYKGARAAASKAAEINPLGYEPWLKLAAVSIAEGDIERARREHGEAFARGRGAKVFVLAAQTLNTKPELGADSLAACDRALAVAPNLLRARFLRITALYNLRRNDEILLEVELINRSRQFQEFFSMLSPKDQTAFWMAQGYAHGFRGDFAEASRCLTKALEAEPDNAQLLLLRGLARIKFDAAGAVEDLRRHLEKNGGKDPASADKARRGLEHLGAAPR